MMAASSSSRWGHFPFLEPKNTRRCFSYRLKPKSLTSLPFSIFSTLFNNGFTKPNFSSAISINQHLTTTTDGYAFRSGEHCSNGSCCTSLSNWRYKRLSTLKRRSFTNSCTSLQSSPISVDDNSDEPPTAQDKRWELMLQELIRYREQYGDTLVPMEFKANPKLGTWVDNQRHQYRCYKAGKQAFIDEERIRILEKEGFIWDVYSLVWEQNLNDLIAYKEKFGECNIPKHTEGYESLWLWSATQRRNYQLRKSGKHSPMTDERIEALEKIGFCWSIHEDLWNQLYDELKDYKAYNGDCMVPKNYKSNPQLARWVDNQRAQYKQWKKGKITNMTEDRISRLEEIDFVWNVPEFKWNVRFEELEQFVQINGHCNVPKKGRSPLYSWCMRQKHEYQKMADGEKSTLTESRMKRLIEIGLLQVP